MAGPRETVNATMLATAIGIDARIEADVRAVVVIDDLLRGIAQKDRARRNILLRIPINIAFDENLLKPVRGVMRRPPAFDCCVTGHLHSMASILSDCNVERLGKRVQGGGGCLG